MKKLSTILVGLFVAANQAIAGPDTISNHLMSDPVSMLDFGMYRMELRLGSTAYVRYDWDDDEIVIFNVVFGFDGSVSDAEVKCKRWVDEVRGMAGIIDGEPFLENSFFADLFAHLAFDRKSAPDNLLLEIDKKFDLNMKVNFAMSAGGSQITCTGPLIGKGFSVENPLR